MTTKLCNTALSQPTEPISRRSRDLLAHVYGADDNRSFGMERIIERLFDKMK